MQLGAVILSPIVGNLYDSIGFRQTYLIMGVIVTTFTLFGAFLLRNQNQASKDRNDSKLTA